MNGALQRQDTRFILSILFDRLYVLRNQFVHGGGIWNSEVNRSRVRDARAVLRSLLLISLNLMMDGSGQSWQMPHYPPDQA